MDEARFEAVIEAVLDLEAKNRALRLIVGYLLAENPTALANVERLSPHASEIAMHFPLTDRQLDVLQEELVQIVDLVRKARPAPAG